MPCENLSSRDFQPLIEENDIVFIDFWADWCAPCKQFSKTYDQVAEQFPAIRFAKINIETEQQLVELFEIRSIPHLMVFKEGIVIYSNAGSMLASALKELAERALEVDVSEIRAELRKES